MLRKGNIAMQSTWALYTTTLEDLTLEAEYEKIRDLTDTNTDNTYYKYGN